MSCEKTIRPESIRHPPRQASAPKRYDDAEPSGDRGKPKNDTTHNADKDFRRIQKALAGQY